MFRSSKNADTSVALQLCLHTTMSSKTLKQPVLAESPLAYCVAEGGLKTPNSAAWEA